MTDDRRAMQFGTLPGDIRAVCDLLSQQYQMSNLGNKRNALDELLYIILSLRTHELGYSESYRRFKARFPSWTLAATASEDDIRDAIKPGGLAVQKAAHIKQALILIQAEFGEVSLRRLRQMEKADAMRFLLRLPGVGVKTAKCILMFSLGFEVLPVDTHVARVCNRLGWLGRGARPKAHEAIEKLIPPELRRRFHVACVMHGRAICRGNHPRCDICCLAKLCPKIGINGLRKPSKTHGSSIR
jgi:endonuclease III